ncbi:MAG: hypothetical protein V3R95_04850 [Dehalococcoidia bacterium]
MTAPSGPRPPAGGRSIALVDWTASATRRVARLVRPVLAAAAPASIARHARYRTPTLGIAMLHRGQSIARRVANRRAASFRPEARLVLRRRIVPQIDTEPRFSIQHRPPAAVIETPEAPSAPAATEAGERAAPPQPEAAAAPPPQNARPAPPPAPSLIVRAVRTVGRLFRNEDDGSGDGDDGASPPSEAPVTVEADPIAPGDEPATARPDAPVRSTEAPPEVDLVPRRSATVEQPEPRTPDAPVARAVEREAEPAPAGAPASEAPPAPETPARADATAAPVVPAPATPIEAIEGVRTAPTEPEVTPPAASRARPEPARPSLVTRIARRVRRAGADEPGPAAPGPTPDPARAPSARASTPAEPPRLEDRAAPPALDPATPEAPAEQLAESLDAPAPSPAPAPVVARAPAARTEPAPLSLVRRVARRVGLDRGAPEPAPAPLPRAEAAGARSAPPAPMSPPSPIARTPEHEIAPPRTVLRETRPPETGPPETGPPDTGPPDTGPPDTRSGERPAAPPLITRAASPAPAAAPAAAAGEPAVRPAPPPPLGTLSVVPPPRPAVFEVPSIVRIYRQRPAAPITATPEPATDPGTFDANTLARAIDAGTAPAEVMAAVEGHALDVVPTSAQGYAIARATGGPVAFPTEPSETLQRVEAPAQPETDTGAPDIDLESLAHQVFSRLRGRLLRERERHGLGYRWR